MKKVLLVTRPIAPPWDEASKNFAYFIAKNTAGIEINLMTKGVVNDLPTSTVQHHVYTKSEISDFKLDQKIRSLIFQFLMRGKFDIVHYFFTPTTLNSFLIKNFLTTKNTKTIQTIATLRDDLWSDEDLKRLVFADLVITYSDYAKNKLNSIGINNIQRIYPGIDLEKYTYKEKDFGCMKTFGIARNDFIITYPGEYTRLGATDSLISMLPELFSKIPNAKFMFACRIKNQKDRVKKDQIIKILKEKNILDKVIFTDTFSDMPLVYNVSDIVLFPVENMRGKFDVPLAVIEAMACEKPVIISNLPILSEFAKPENSVVIEPGNQGMILDAINDLYLDRKKAESLGKAARKYVEKDFDIKNVAQRYTDAYNTL